MMDIVCIAGFGDNASMYEPLMQTKLAREHNLIGLNLPGFGVAPIEGPVTLNAMAGVLHEHLTESGARVVMAHSVASIIAALSAQIDGSPIDLILSLEGNLTPEDAYFSGSAAGYGSAEAFRSAFLARLGRMVETGGSEIARYREHVARADLRSLWELGCDAHDYSNKFMPGEDLKAARRAVYFYNPDNLPGTSRRWLTESVFERRELLGASHWPTIDQPAELSAAILAVF